jgi:hypothetical protein
VAAHTRQRRTNTCDEALKMKVPEHAGFIYSPPETEWELNSRASNFEAIGPDDAQQFTSNGRALPAEQAIDLALGRTSQIRWPSADIGQL